MKAYRVFYQTAGRNNNMIVLAESEDELDKALAEKDEDFRIGSKWSKIDVKYETPLSSVMVKDLSVGELLRLIEK